MAGSEVLGTAFFVLVIAVVLGVLLFVQLVVLRLSRMAIDRRDRRRRSHIRDEIFAMVLGEGAEADEGRAALMARRGRQWDFAEAQAFEMMSKLKGDARHDLIELVRERGALKRARRELRSRSAVHRCRGAFYLGLLRDVESLPDLIRMLSDADFLVRRTGIRALGNLAEADAVPALLAEAGGEPRLARDLVYALHRIGTPGAGALRHELTRALADPDNRGLHGDMAATVLGLLDDFASVPLLSAGLESANLGLAMACAEALGRVGSPDSIGDLVTAMFSDRQPLRAAAVHALGELGSPVAVDSLLSVVEEDSPIVSRQAADALRELGEPGIGVLRTSSSRYAIEAVNLEQVGARR